ncbi:dihydrofolate reductase family protein [Curtobacterium sp. 458]|uniref:dihydrofolate reductase family protein n=1 Tax=Curtobacterium sp. 458 TaxID=3050069 RepID=UPI0025B2C6D1|nr:dihydrofolate reductase family protein [Curtobacterium sp. 458]WJY01059.1 dihydrofolate reductase family protein [Curtobacterium sp. 458]
MGTLVVVENVSLDGVMQAPASPDEDTRGGFRLGGWAVAPLAADPEAAMAAFGGGSGSADGAMLFGRRTYSDVVGHWLGVTEENPFTPVLRDTRKYVVTRDPDLKLPYPNSERLAGDLGAAVRRAVDTVEGEVVVLGSGDVVRQLAALGLVDRYVLTLIPVVLGGGQRLFGDIHAELQVVRTSVSPTGIVTGVYDVVH